MKKNQVLSFIKEIIIVVLGVLIAVSISNYKENIDNEKYLKRTLSAIENEIVFSKNGVDTILKRHIKLYEKIENEFMNQENTTIGEFVSNSGGFQVASIKNISLRFFVANKAELLDINLISQLLDIELSTNLLSKKIERFSDFAYDQVNSKSNEVKVKFTYLLLDVIDGEETLLKSYSVFLEENKKYLSDKTK